MLLRADIAFNCLFELLNPKPYFGTPQIRNNKILNTEHTHTHTRRISALAPGLCPT